MFTPINPATGEAGTPIPELTADEVEERVARAAAGFRQWRTTDYATRTALLERIAEVFDANKMRLAEIATREMGKTLKSAISEVEKCAAGFRHYAQNGPDMLAPQEFPTPNGKAVARWLPMGPVLAIMPWNFPYGRWSAGSRRRSWRAMSDCSSTPR